MGLTSKKAEERTGEFAGRPARFLISGVFDEFLGDHLSEETLEILAFGAVEDPRFHGKTLNLEQATQCHA